MAGEDDDLKNRLRLLYGDTALSRNSDLPLGVAPERPDSALPPLPKPAPPDELREYNPDPLYRAQKGAAQLGTMIGRTPYEVGASSMEGLLHSYYGKYGPAALSAADVLAMFAGPRAKTANLAQLERAHGMKSLGIPPEVVWRETGWRLETPDGIPRFEVSDHAAGYHPAAQALPSKEVLDHPALYAAYPEMAETPWVPVPKERMPDTWGKQVPGMGVLIRSDVAAGRSGKGTTLHEKMHELQDLEGFAPGASPSGAWSDPALAPIAQEYFMRHQKQWAAANPSAKASPEGLTQKWIDDAARRAYQDSAGEVEARNVKRRAELTDEQRRNLPPWQTEDVPLERQVVSPRRAGSAESGDAPTTADILRELRKKYGSKD